MNYRIGKIIDASHRQRSFHEIRQRNSIFYVEWNTAYAARWWANGMLNAIIITLPRSSRVGRLEEAEVDTSHGNSSIKATAATSLRWQSGKLRTKPHIIEYIREFMYEEIFDYNKFDCCCIWVRVCVRVCVYQWPQRHLSLTLNKFAGNGTLEWNGMYAIAYNCLRLILIIINWWFGFLLSGGGAGIVVVGCADACCAYLVDFRHVIIVYHHDISKVFAVRHSIRIPCISSQRRTSHCHPSTLAGLIGTFPPHLLFVDTEFD